MFRWLLRLYPASFRNEYGREMQTVFARQRRDMRTPIGLAALWIRVIVDVCRSAAAIHWDILIQDLRYTVRAFARTPGFVLTAVSVVALGIGATTAAFSVTDFVLLRPLPFPDSDRLVRVWEQRPGYARMELSPANYRDWKNMAASYDAFAAYRGLSVNFVGASQPLRLQGAALTADVFDALAVRPLFGRPFSADDDHDGSPRTVLLSHGLWQQEFGGDPSVLGRTVRLDDQPYTVIGVMPREFTFPTRQAQLWTATRFAPSEFVGRNNNYLNVIARLRRGVSLDAARSEMSVLTARLKEQYPKDNDYTSANVIALRDELSQQTRVMLIALLGAAACVLLIACANLANLMLARAIARRRELAVRVALGAGRERLLRQLLTESLLLTSVGGVLGVALATVALPMLSRLVPAVLPIGETPAIDVRVLAFASSTTLLTGLVFGIMPLLQRRRGGTGDGLRDGSRGGIGRREGLRGALVAAQVTASVVLLVLCGLLLRALWTIQAIDPGFTVEQALTVRTSLPMPKYEVASVRTTFYTRVLSELRTVPGVSAAAYISFLPLSDMRGGIFPVAIDTKIDDRRENYVAFLRYVTPGFFRALNIPLQRGRDVSDSDRIDVNLVAVVIASFAARFFPGQDPIGRRFDFANATREIVGVVADVKMRGLTRVSEPQVYLPYLQQPDRTREWFAPKDLIIRTSADPLSLVPQVRAIVSRADADIPLSEVQTLEDLVTGDTASRGLQLRVLEAFAAVALVLSAIGIHGLLAFAVSARRAEIGVRMALGAQRRDVIAMIAKRSMMLAVIGIVAGVVLAYLAGRTIDALLAGVSPADGLTYVVAIVVAFVTTLAGSVQPALRAARVDPVSVIRLE